MHSLFSFCVFRRLLLSGDLKMHKQNGVSNERSPSFPLETPFFSPRPRFFLLFKSGWRYPNLRSSDTSADLTRWISNERLSDTRKTHVSGKDDDWGKDAQNTEAKINTKKRKVTVSHRRLQRFQRCVVWINARKQRLQSNDKSVKFENHREIFGDISRMINNLVLMSVLSTTSCVMSTMTTFETANDIRSQHTPNTRGCR